MDLTPIIEYESFTAKSRWNTHLREESNFHLSHGTAGPIKPEKFNRHLDRKNAGTSFPTVGAVL